MFRARKNNIITAPVLALTITAALWCGIAGAQDTGPSGDSAAVKLDSLPYDSIVPPPSACDTTVADTMVPESVSLHPIMYTPGPDTVLMAAYRDRMKGNQHRRSPTLTLFKSVVFPGWGQFSNGKYVKAGLVFAVESYFIYKAVYYGNKASDWRAKWKAAPSSEKYLYFTKYTDYRDTRNSFLWYTGLTVFLSMFDAYVDAHLANFPKDIPTSDNISLDFDPGPESRLALTYHF
jgi:hypothetical protein